MADAHKNFAISAVATPPSPALSGTTLTLTAGHGGRFPMPPFNATVWKFGVNADPTNAEVVRIIAMAGDAVTTMLRGQEGGPARTIVVGDQIAATLTAKTLTDVEGDVADVALQALMGVIG